MVRKIGAAGYPPSSVTVVCPWKEGCGRTFGREILIHRRKIAKKIQQQILWLLLGPLQAVKAKKKLQELDEG